MEFEYFRYPEKFTYIIDSPEPCSICGTVGLCFDSGGYSGVNNIDCICANCLQSGELIDLEIEPNMNFDDGSEAAKTITYKTPSLPTWQDTAWPMIDGEFPIFERIASVEDFKDKEEFLNTFVESDQTKEEVEWLWERLPRKQLNHYNEAGNISIYLFSLKDKKYWVWDAN